jgi:NitT/TauT family transport system substrate-binding protein
MTRADLLAGTAASSLALGLGVRPAFADAPLKPILLAEPAHLFPYVPVYMAIDAGIFAKHGLAVSTTMIGGGAHVQALISGQVWGNIGGSESDAMADNGAIADPLITICNLINRALVYFVAKKGTAPKSMAAADVKAFFKGKKCALSRYGGTPDVLARTYMVQNGVDLKNDVTIVNNALIAAAPDLIRSGAADIAIATEPQVSFGIAQGIWDEPFFSFPSLGEYSFTVLSTKKSTIANDPATVQAFVSAMVEALKLTQTHRPLVEAAIKKDFPNIADSVAKAALDRCYRDRLFSLDGIMSSPAYDKDMASVYASGEMTRHVPYSEVADMSFVLNAHKSTK